MEIGIRELRARLSHYVGLVRGGEEIVVTERGRPVARLIGSSDGSAMDRLVAQGIVRMPSEPRQPARAVKRVRSDGSVAGLVAEQRR